MKYNKDDNEKPKKVDSTPAQSRQIHKENIISSN